MQFRKLASGLIGFRRRKKRTRKSKEASSVRGAGSDNSGKPPKAVREKNPDPEALFKELALLNQVEYDQRRKAEAKRLDIRVAILDREVAKYHQSRRRYSNNGAIELFEPEPWAELVDGTELLDALVDAFSQHLVLPEGAAEAMALWVLFVHTFETWDASPRLAVISPTHRCGKTTCFEILQHLVPRSLLASNVTSAVVYRAIELAKPVLLMDEADTYMPGHVELRGILNSGHTRTTAFVLRSSGENYEPQRFSTWTPIAFARIGKPHFTLEDRSITICMHRRRRNEKVQRLRTDKIKVLKALNRKAARWSQDNGKILRNADPSIPGGLHDRAADNWRPLLAIAECSGGDWSDRARSASLMLSNVDGVENATDGIRLLTDIRAIFDERDVDRLPSNELCQELGRVEESPWAHWKGGWINPNHLAGLLRPFGVRSRDIRFGPKVRKGYDRERFEDAFARYLPPQSATPQQPNDSSGLEEE